MTDMPDEIFAFVSNGGMKIWIRENKGRVGRSDKPISYTRTDKLISDLSAAHHDISRLQGELKDALEDLRGANRLLELAENSLFIGLKIRNDVHPSNYEPLERAIMQIQAYRNRGQKP